jgi:lipopolysaccharide heptosyltransferase II
MIYWKNSKNILCIRADNMGDVLMTSPALRALKQTFDFHITLLTSTQGRPICSSIPEIDEVLIADLPWVKLNSRFDAGEYRKLVDTIRARNFDGAIIFTVYSQSSLPAALLCYEAGIPLRLAYARENPYALLTDWVPDKEPYTRIRHQVERDLALVGRIEAVTDDINLSLRIRPEAQLQLEKKLLLAGIPLPEPYLVFHSGVSEEKREYPAELWKKVIENNIRDKATSILLTGSAAEKHKVDALVPDNMPGVHNLAGLLSLEELALLIKGAGCVLSVNTAIVHIAAAVKTPVVVLYAMTNPQHTPWGVSSKVLQFSVDPRIKSKNEVIRYVDQHLYNNWHDYPTPETISSAIYELMRSRADPQLLPGSLGK